MAADRHAVRCKQVCGRTCAGAHVHAARVRARCSSGLSTEAAYPYAESDGLCRAPTPAAQLAGAAAIPRGDAAALAAAVAQHGAVTAIVEVLNDFVFYAAGVYRNPSCDGRLLSHAVTVVGFGTDASAGDYWIVKNSFGKDWGEAGFFRMARGIKCVRVRARARRTLSQLCVRSRAQHVRHRELGSRSARTVCGQRGELKEV